MTGTDYRATTELTDADGNVIAAEGDTCGAVPDESLSWLIEQGVIVPVNASAPDVAPVEAPVEAPEADTAEDTDEPDTTDEGNED